MVRLVSLVRHVAPGVGIDKELLSECGSGIESGGIIVLKGYQNVNLEFSLGYR